MVKRVNRKSTNIGDKSSVSKQAVKSMINSSLLKQVNYVDQNYSVSSTTTGSFNDITSIGAGSGANTRSGSKITIRKIRLYWNCTIGDVTNFCRFVLFFWRPSSTSDTPSNGELFFETGAVTPWNSPFQGVTPSRFQILFDHTVALDAAHIVKNGTIILNNIDHTVGYDNGVSTGPGHLYLCMISDSAAVPHPNMTGAVQVIYDI